DSDPDIANKAYGLVYNITRPRKAPFRTSAPGASYTYTLSAITSSGTDVTSRGFSLSGSDEVLTVAPDSSLQDSLIYVSITATSVAHGCDTVLGRYIYVPHFPKPNFNSADICFGDVAIFKNTTTLNGNGVLKSHWEFNDPSGSTLDTSNYTDGLWVYEQYGDSVDVELSVTDNHYPKFWYTITKTIKVTPYPTINFSVVNECLGKPITIQNRTSLPSDFNGQIDYWLDFDGEYTATQEPLSYAFPTSGQRKLTLYASTNGCTSEQEKNAYQFESPVSDFSHQGSCNLAEVSFSNTSTIEGTSHLSYIWKFDKTESRHSDPKVTFDSSGAHSITLIANSIFGCSDTLTTTIVLKESPKADFEYNRACNKSATQFLQTGTVPNDGSNSSYLWDFDGINSSQEKNPSHLFTDIGKKKITLRIDDLNGCSHSTTKNIVVKTEAVADFTTNSTCARSIAVFGNSSTIEEGELSFKWDFGDGS
ncbi:MAG: PKD domain-containing protein, partial [Bacteroidia bacterium]